MKYTQELRLLRTSPPTMAKRLADDPDIEVDDTVKTRKKSTPKVVKSDDFLAKLNARLATP